MADNTQYLIRNSDTQIKLQLLEDDVAISGAWTQVDVHIGSVTITRNADGNGVALSTGDGTLTLTPADITEDLSGLVAGRTYRGYVVVTDAINDDGIVWGNDGHDRLFFVISDKP